MKLKISLIAAALAALAAPPAMADPCGAVLCLSTNKTAPYQCKGHVDEYFNIKVYVKPCKKCGEVFDPGATAAKRYREVMDKCTEARQKDKDYVNATYGTLERSPFDYVNVDDKGNETGYNQVSLMDVTEQRTLSCPEAAQTQAYGPKIAEPTWQAKAVPNGYQLLDGNGQVAAVANGGYADGPLYVDQSSGWGGTTIYGAVLETRTITKTTGQGKVVNVTEWKATKTNSCKMADPSAFQAAYVQSDSGG